MTIKAWGFVPARGGSKSIVRKNLVRVAGRTLVEYVSLAARACGPALERLIGSTEDDEIAGHMRDLMLEVDARPASLATDAAPIADVARDFLERQQSAGVAQPEVLVLFQPTSPFILSEHVLALLDTMARDPACRSAHTIAPCPHNHHELNQRWYENGRAGFVYAEQRAIAYNKQTKPKRWVFGNLVAVRTDALLAGCDFFAVPSAAVPIAPPYDLDVDGPSDIAVAETMVQSGLVHLPHLKVLGGLRS